MQILLFYENICIKYRKFFSFVNIIELSTMKYYNIFLYSSYAKKKKSYKLIRMEIFWMLFLASIFYFLTLKKGIDC